MGWMFLRISFISYFRQFASWLKWGYHFRALFASYQKKQNGSKLESGVKNGMTIVQNPQLETR